MDKSEAEILEEWTLVSSVYDTEQEKNMTENQKTDPEAVAETDDQTSVSAVSEATANNNTENSISSVNESTARVDNEPDSNEKVSVSDTNKNAETENSETSKLDSGEKDIIDDTEISLVESKDSLEVDSEEGAEADTEDASEPDAEEEITVIETIMYNVKKIEDISDEKTSHPEDITNSAKDVSDMNLGRTEELEAEKNGSEVIESDVAAPENIMEVESETTKQKLDSVVECNVGNQNVDRLLESNLDSSVEHIQMEQPQHSSIQELPKLIPSLTEQETTGLESSSSDIDIIDEIMEESVTSSFVHPLSISISSSADTPSATTSPSDKDEGPRITEKSEVFTKIEETKPKTVDELESYSKKAETHVWKSESPSGRSDHEYQRYSHEERSERRPESRRHQSQNVPGIVGLLMQFLRRMTLLEWSLLGGVLIGVYLTVVFNQTNIFAVVQREDVVSQMKKMIDELKHDNKLLKEQMLSEMKNEKVFSSFENQIRELRKENSRFNHMLYDVAKVLDKQKDFHKNYEKKESEDLASFKKEINQLKEHINILKFDNEELQKQLVRMRYASYSQGGGDAGNEKHKAKEQKEEVKSDESDSDDEIPLDISLKKWNELVSLLGKELGLSLESEKIFSETKKINSVVWYWKGLLKEFKGTLDDLKANITSKFSDYKKIQENTMTNLYTIMKNFFSVDEQNNQQFVPPGEESSQWKNIGDFFNDLKTKWSNIKNRIDTTDLKKFFKEFKMSKIAEPYEQDTQKPKSSSFDYTERKPTTVHFESEKKPPNAHFESERKSGNIHFRSDKRDSEEKHKSDDSQWMFERAVHRAELREEKGADDESVNWYLKKNKRASKDDVRSKY